MNGRALLLLALALLGCAPAEDRPLLVRPQALPARAVSLRLDAQLADHPATEVKEVRYGLDLFGVRLPKTAKGPLRLQLDALDGERCVVARGFLETTVEQRGAGEVALPLRALEAPLCRCAAMGWCWEAPLPQGNHLRAVFTLAPNDAWAVGDYGTVFRWDGAAWHSVASGSIAHLHGVWASADNDVWAVGERGTVLHWNGVNWIAVNSRMTVTEDLDAVWGFAGGEVWAAGDNGTLVRVTGAGNIVEEPVGTRLRLRGLWGFSPYNLWVVGDGGFVRRRTQGGWLPPAGMTADRDLYAVSGYGVHELWAVGDMGTILHIVDGQVRSEGVGLPVDLRGVWVPAPAGIPPPELPQEVWAVGAARGLARGALLRRREGAWAQQSIANLAAANIFTGVHGAGAEDLWVTGLYGTLLRRISGDEIVLGAQNTTRSLRALWGSGPEDVWAIGAHEGLPAPTGVLLHWDGASWKDERIDQTDDLLSVWGSGPADVWASGRRGAVLRRDGVAWSAEDVSSFTKADLLGIWAGGGEVWTVGSGGVVLRRAGGRWARVQVDPRYDLSAVFGVTGAGSPEIWIGGSDAMGRGVLLRGGGGTLTQVPAGTFAKVLAIAGSGPRDVWAAIDKGPMLRFNGARFDAVDTGTTRSLSGMWFFSPDDGWAVGEEGRIFFWNGATWARLISGTNNDLNAVFGTSLRNLWAVGNGGTVLRQRL